MNEEHIKLNADYNRLKSVTIPGLEKSIDAIRAKTSDMESAINEAKKETAKLETTFSSRFNKIDVALGLILQSMGIPPEFHNTHPTTVVTEDYLGVEDESILNMDVSDASALVSTANPLLSSVSSHDIQ